MAFDKLMGDSNDKASRIEGLLRKLGGQLRRASELAPTRGSRNLSLDELFPDARVIGGDAGGVRHRVTEIPICEGGEGGHPRGYVFSPVPDWRHHSPRLDPDIFLLLGCEPSPDEPVPLERLVFLDTETTGLSGMTGTYAFLVGLGYFRVRWPKGRPRPTEAVFVCEQYFMEDFPHEPVLLEALGKRLREFDVLVTFNGAGYDVPLLEVRAKLNRMRLPLDRPHLDLLWPARRLWRRKLPSCGLASLERHILGVRRTHDVLGAEIPYIYFDHLRGLRRERLVPVFDHNVQDIVSLGALLLRLRELALQPEHEALTHAAEVFGLGRLHLEAGNVESAVAFLERAGDFGPDPDWLRTYLREMLRLYRREGNYEAGLELLEAQCRRWGRRIPELYEELAKWCERYARNPQKALAVIQQAEVQGRFEREVHRHNPDQFYEWTRVLMALEKRKMRLLKKLQR
jgi:uncharacterized protein YprB with RNaseH-like and TPR domain